MQLGSKASVSTTLKDKKIVLVLPAFNEQRTIAEVVLRAERFVDEIVVVDDGSSDLTPVIAQRLGAKVIRHDENLGKGLALKTGFEYAKQIGTDVVVTLDTDGQHDPAEIPKIVEPIIKGEADMVVGSRFLGKGRLDMPVYRRIGLGIINQLSSRVSRFGVMDTQSGFRAYSRAAAQIISSYESSGYGIELEQLAIAAKNGLKVVEVPISVRYKGLERTSKRHPLKHGGELISTVLRLVMEERPLLFLGVPGVVSLLVGVLFGVWMLQIYAIERRIITNIALASMAFILIGFFAVSTAITLYAIARLVKKTTKQ